MQRPPYSYRDDPAVPAFPDDLPVVVFDGVCGMCSAFVRLLLAIDGTTERHRFISAQAPLGAALYRHYGRVPDETFLVLTDGRCRVKADAVLATFAGLGPAWSLPARAARLVPPRWADAAYNCVAKNRYRIWGGRDTCLRPPPGTEARFLA
ncbi:MULTISPECIES: thiol-disulfide oxidoreductase DCC family protein [Methylobacterium]|uniref:DUF393 domain-containing protein n=1 Tax=Methylobacterium thuringiense TaxID=1003091 RepID=A0ABQ4TIY6_9HYPH|nr:MULTISPECIES: DCC1-like thiol-disulfide oxidoreductase family protein [Methylobacterium]TXN19832.1 DUF393 domain-containing protein [Methylobacterium sp. WL9]GJE55360.1 hypothetical protein EKPJFOCH_1851 [Methylobacterium thuringiense]